MTRPDPSAPAAERPTTRLRRLIEAPEILAMPGVYNGFSIRMVEQAGYPAAFITGSGISEDALGWPDVGIMGLEENLRVTRALVACSAIPLIADADTGYGNAVNVHFTVRAFENAGVAGLMLEDQVWPKRCGHMAGKSCIPAEEMVEKLHAAVDARRDPDLIIKARTDAAAPYGLDEAIRRLNLYAEAGADLLFADALLSREDIARVAAEVSKPLSVNMGFGIRARPTTPLLSARELEGMGVGAVIFPRLLTAAAIRGMRNALEALGESLRSGEVVERPDLMVDFEELNDLVGFQTIGELERRYGTGAAAGPRRG
jgi:2-methylisocitrate lyase-like PEP mutase family enzyme